MADNKGNGSIFQGILGALKRNRFRPNEPDFPQTQSFSPLKYQNGPVTGSLEDKQQAFLDWQSQKIAHDLYTRTIYYDTDRVNAYQDYRAMDMSPEIAAALDIMRDESLTKSERGNILEVYSENIRVKKVLQELFKHRINADFNLRLWIRELCKYGDFFLLLKVDKDTGIYDVMALPQEEIHREEGYDGNPSSVRFRWETHNLYFEEWQIAHFRLLEDTKRLPYGRSILDPARKLWKQLQLAEDAMLVYRLTRAPERRVFYIEVGNLESQDVIQYIEQMKTRLKRQPVVDQRTGRMNLKYNPMTIEEDYFIPIRGDKNSRIETLPGAANMSDIADVEYLQNKLFASIKVPKTYLNYSESMPGGSTLSQADLRFARTINTIQESVLLELRRIANVHLYFLGFEDDMDNFTLSLTNPSTQQELLKLEAMKARMEVFSQMFTPDASAPVSYTWGMENILGFSKAEIKLILKQKKIEKKIFAEIDSAVENYKNSGLFQELDIKYNKQGVGTMGETGGEAGLGDMSSAGEEMGGDGNESGGGGESVLGGIGATGGAAEFGAETGEAPSPEAPAPEAPAPESGAEAGGATISEALKKRNDILGLVYENIDQRVDDMLEELLGEDEEDIVKIIEDDNVLLENNNKMLYKTKNMLKSLKNYTDKEKE